MISNRGYSSDYNPTIKIYNRCIPTLNLTAEHHVTITHCHVTLSLVDQFGLRVTVSSHQPQDPGYCSPLCVCVRVCKPQLCFVS